MNRSIKISLITLLFVTTGNILGSSEGENLQQRNEQRSEQQAAAEEEQARKQAQEHDLQERLNRDRNLFFHSDRVSNLNDVRITDHDNKSISSLRRWWDNEGIFTKKGNLTIVSDAFKRGEDFRDFSEPEEEAFKALDTDDQITLGNEYVDNLKTGYAKKIKAEVISFNNTSRSLKNELNNLNQQKSKLEAEIKALDKKEWNIYRIKHIFKNYDERDQAKIHLNKDLKDVEKKINTKKEEINKTEQNHREKIKTFRNKFDENIKKFADVINPLLETKNIQLRFDVKTATFQVHKANPTLEARLAPTTTNASQAAAAAGGGGGGNPELYATLPQAAANNQEDTIYTIPDNKAIRFNKEGYPVYNLSDQN